MLDGEPREGSGGRSIAAIRAAALRYDRVLFLAARLDVVFKSKLIFRGGGELANDARPLFLTGGAYLPFAIRGLGGLGRPPRAHQDSLLRVSQFIGPYGWG